MSNFKGHATAGVTAAMGIGGALWATGQGVNLSIGCGLATFLCSLFPDLDVKSTPSKCFYWGVLLGLGWLYWAGQHRLAHLLAMVAILPQLLNHRGILHAKVTSVVLPMLAISLTPLGILPLHDALLLGGAGVVGYNVHLLLDGVWV